MLLVRFRGLRSILVRNVEEVPQVLWRQAQAQANAQANALSTQEPTTASSTSVATQSSSSSSSMIEEGGDDDTHDGSPYLERSNCRPSMWRPVLAFLLLNLLFLTFKNH